MKPYAIGVDIGGTSIKFGLFTSQGELLEKWSMDTRTETGGMHILPDVSKAILRKLEEQKILPAQVEGIGIGVPGPVDAQSNVFFCVNLGWKEKFSLKQRMNELLPDIPKVLAANDANTAALGELWKGGGQGYKSTVMLTLGTGVGGGVVMSGAIVAGAHGGAGEIGHITVNHRETAVCSCGKRGCLEQYASARGIVRLAKEMLSASEKPSALREMETFSAKDICDLARDGEEMAHEILLRCGRFLGRAMSFVACALDPDVFIIGGGMSRAGDILMEAIRLGYRKYAFQDSKDTPVTSARLWNDAGIYGCVKMVL